MPMTYSSDSLLASFFLLVVSRALDFTDISIIVFPTAKFVQLYTRIMSKHDEQLCKAILN